MKIAFVLYDGMTSLDFIGVYDPLTRLQSMGLRQDVSWDVCALTEEVRDGINLRFTATCVAQPLSGYDLIVVPGGFSTRTLMRDETFLAWLRTAKDVPLKASVCTGALLLGAAGFLKGRAATTHQSAYRTLEPYCKEVRKDRIVDEGDVITAGGVTAAIDLGLYLTEKLAGQMEREAIRQQMEYPLLPAKTAAPRTATVDRLTNETQIHIELGLDGTGRHQIETGVGFLDHMLTHIAVHGLFDLTVRAQGDLHIDVHHTVEDVALALGQAFAEALGDRKGIVRMGSAYAPMDDTLAFAAVDLSGRPYAVIQANWHSPQVGGIPTTLFPHFLESFAFAARLNLHARIETGRDDHHQAEALFKALARALDGACQSDPRRGSNIPSTKGTLTA